MFKISLRTLFLFTILTFVVVPLVAYAQSGPLDVSLYSIDYSEFPTVRIPHGSPYGQRQSHGRIDRRLCSSL